MTFWDRVKRVFSGAPWTDLMADPGNRPRLTVEVFYELQRKGVRARYRVVGTGGGPGTPVGSVGQSIKIEVREDDLAKAREILDEYRRGQAGGAL